MQSYADMHSPAQTMPEASPLCKSPARSAWRRCVACATAALLMMWQPGQAQPARPPTATYSLRAAINDALTRNPALAISQAERAAAGHLREGAEWGRYPTVSAEVAPGTQGGTQTFRVEQPLWSGGRISGQIDASRAQESAAALAEIETRRQLTEQTSVAYLGWLGAHSRLQLAVDGGAVFERLLAHVRRREAAGAAAASDVSVAVARLAVAAAQREQLAAELDRAAAELQALVVGELGAPVLLKDPVFAGTDREATEVAYLAQSNTVARRQAELQAAQAATVVSKGQALPTLALRVERVQYTGNSLPGQSSQTRALLALSFAPGAGLSSLSAANAAASRERAVADQVRAEQISVQLRARSQWSEHQGAQRQLAELRPQIDALQLTADSYMRQFEAGRRTWIEVLNIHREALDARISTSRTQTQLAQSALRLLANTQGLAPWIDTTPQ